MPFTVTTQPVTAGGRTDVAYVLSDTAGTARAEVWPGFGFNCLRWQVRQPDGSWGDVLYCDPTWEQNPVPTRSGHPILFPFPNRLKYGRFTFDGREYQLPLNESTGTHAIHGFTPRNPWRVVGAGGEKDHAFVTGQFHLTQDLPGSAHLWPADFVFTVTYQLSADALTVECLVENPDTKPLPFGIGYHPYFCCPDAPGATADEMVLQAATGELWEADAGIPTGNRLPVPGELDFRKPRTVGATTLDTLYSIRPHPPAPSPTSGRGGENPTTPLSPLTSAERSEARGRGAGGEGLTLLATLSHPSSAGQLTVSAPAAFRELLLFTPPHRKAVAIEPYTCATNAANMPDAGWRVLPPGGQFSATVEYRWRAG